MLRIHPFQNVYFNDLLSHTDPSHKYDIDYYGLSFKQALETLCEKTNNDSIRVAFSSFHGMNNKYILTPDLRKKIIEVGADSAKYFITNHHRNMDSKEKIELKRFPYNQRVLDSIKWNDCTINTTFLIK
jgi:hypothetical protein